MLLVPGFTEDINTRDYPKLIKAIEKCGYKVKFIPIKWKYTNINDWVAQLHEEYLKHDPKNAILAGFSFGAMTVFVEAAHRQPSELWLFSLSPYFNGDYWQQDSIKERKQVLRIVGKKRLEVFAAIDFERTSTKISCPTFIFVVEKETLSIKKRANLTLKKLKNSKLIVAEGAGHDVAHPNYVNAITKNI